MKKKLMILAFAFGGLFMIGNNVFATDPDDSADPGEGGGGGNSATCYSTYRDPGFFEKGFNIFVCGTCEQVKAKDWSDSGVCNF